MNRARGSESRPSRGEKGERGAVSSTLDFLPSTLYSPLTNCADRAPMGTVSRRHPRLGSRAASVIRRRQAESWLMVAVSRSATQVRIIRQPLDSHAFM